MAGRIAAIRVEHDKFPARITDEIDLLKYAPGLSYRERAVLVSAFVIIVVRVSSRQLYTINHLDIEDNDRLIVLVDSWYDLDTGTHRSPYLRGWFLAQPSFAQARKKNTETGIIEAVYVESDVLRRKNKSESLAELAQNEMKEAELRRTRMEEIKTILAPKNLSKREEDKLNDEYAKLRAIIHVSAYVRHVPLKECARYAVLKAAIYDVDPNRSKAFNSKPTAAAMLTGIVHLPRPDAIVTEATGAPWTYARGDDREAAIAACSGPDTDLSGSVFLVGDTITAPSKWIASRFVVPIGKGRCVVDVGKIMNTPELKVLLADLIINMGTKYGGARSRKTGEPRGLQKVVRIVRNQISAGEMQTDKVSPLRRKVAELVIANSTKKEKKRLDVGSFVSGVSFDSLPECFHTLVIPEKYGEQNITNDKRFAWCGELGVAGFNPDDFGDIEDLLKQTKFNKSTSRIRDIKKQIEYAVKNPKPFPCRSRPGPYKASERWTCPYQGKDVDNVAICMRNRKLLPGKTIPPDVSPGMIARLSVPIGYTAPPARSFSAAAPSR